MRFKRVERKCKTDQWYEWFAWYPVEIGNEYVWMEKVERREVIGKYPHARAVCLMSPFDTEYRNIEAKP